jgi:hypothetical protein
MPPTAVVSSKSAIGVAKSDSGLDNFLQFEELIGSLDVSSESEPEDLLNSVVTLSLEDVTPQTRTDSSSETSSVRFGRLADPSDSVGRSAASNDSEMVGEYLAAAHGSGKVMYQTLNEEEERALCRVLPRALKLGQRDVYDAIAKELEVPVTHPCAHKVMTNITMFFAKDARNRSDSVPSVKTEPVIMAPVVGSDDSSDSDDYF